MSEKTKVLLFSYIPMSDWQSVARDVGPQIDPSAPGGEELMAQTLQKMMQDAPRIEGVLWGIQDDYACPIFIAQNRAHELAAHMEEWAENDPTRFTLHISERGHQYGVMLMPDIKASIKRWALNQQRMGLGIVNVNDYDFNIFFQCVGTVCPDSHAYMKLKPMLGNRTNVGFINYDDLNFTDVGATDSSKIIYIGPFDINKEQSDVAEQHFDNWFKEMNEED